MESEKDGTAVLFSYLDNFWKTLYNKLRSRKHKSSGCRAFPAEIGRNRVLTREPDTVSTVGGKDAHMGYCQYRIAPRRM